MAAERGARVWGLLGRRAGDNAQIRALAARIGAETRFLTLDFNWRREAPNHLLGATLASTRNAAEIAPPWPEIVIGAGRRSVPAARWIAAASGARLVWIGRPRAPLEWFDLVLTTPQYGLPAAPNVELLDLPLGASLPEPAGPPVLAVVLGGDSWTMRIDEAATDRLGRAARRFAEETGLPVSAMTSPRTAPGLAARLAAACPPGAAVFDWRAGGDNPYRADMARAGRALVTGDSVSVLADAVASGAPVSVLTPPERGWVRAVRRVAPGGNAALLAPPPDILALHRHLVARGLARPGEDGLLHLDAARAPVAARQEAATARARALLG